MVDEAGDFMSLMGSTSKPCASGGRGFSFQSDAIRANAAERFRAARIAFLRKYPFRSERTRRLSPASQRGFSCARQRQKEPLAHALRPKSFVTFASATALLYAAFISATNKRRK